MKHDNQTSSRCLHPVCSASSRAKLWALHEIAEMEMLIVAREKPRRPWYRKRAARAIKAYEQTLAAVPDVPNDQGHASLP